METLSKNFFTNQNPDGRLLEGLEENYTASAFISISNCSMSFNIYKMLFDYYSMSFNIYKLSFNIYKMCYCIYQMRYWIYQMRYWIYQMCYCIYQMCYWIYQMCYWIYQMCYWIYQMCYCICKYCGCISSIRIGLDNIVRIFRKHKRIQYNCNLLCVDFLSFVCDYFYKITQITEQITILPSRSPPNFA